MKVMTTAAVLAAGALAAACARFEFYTDPSLQGPETGIKFYAPKPYVLVGRVGGSNKPVEVSIVYLPDLSQPYYAKARSGWGSSNLTMKLSDGALTECGQQVDSKGPETLSGIASLATALRARSTNLAPNAALEFSLYEIDTTKSPAVLKEVTIPQPDR